MRILFIAAGMAAFGVAYAWRIATKPFDVGKTWQSVVIGDAVTDCGSSLVLWVALERYIPGRRNRLAICLIPWISHAITGLPMIVGQLLKDRFEREQFEQMKDNKNRANHRIFQN